MTKKADLVAEIERLKVELAEAKAEKRRVQREMIARVARFRRLHEAYKRLKIRYDKLTKKG